MTVESGQGAEGMEEDSLFLSMTPMLGQIMLISKMTYAYLDNNNGDLHRELLLACLLCVIKSGVRQMNTLKLNVLNEDYEENMKQVQKTQPGTVRPPLIACETAPKLSNFELICQLTERSTYEIACSLPDKISENINLFSFICYT